MRIVAISDTHNKHHQLTLPEGDVLVHAGDITNRGYLGELEDFASWLNVQDFKHKVIVCGNHDFCFQESRPEEAIRMIREAGGTYLQDSSVSIHGVNFWGAPWQPWFYDWAFNLHRGEEIAAKWKLIPDNTNVLITHGPPMGILDLIDTHGGDEKHEGCQDLIDRVNSLENLKVHIFGHFHFQGGNIAEVNGKIFANAAMCTDRHRITRQPVVIDI